MILLIKFTSYKLSSEKYEWHIHNNKLNNLQHEVSTLLWTEEVRILVTEHSG